MITVHTIAELRAQIAAWRRAGERIAFVPTMGNLHRGHLELVRRARERAGRVVASVFVNPLQFGPNEDFERYPRTLAQDRAGLEQAQCDLLFAPTAREIYPRGMDGLTRIGVPGISTVLCGEFRPGHFDGVATVVAILFNLVQPDAALFGEKDYQQLLVIRRMTADLHLPVEIVGVPTQRDADGLALSSRNQYLSADERPKAALIHRTMQDVAAELRRGNRDYRGLREQAAAALAAAGFRPQYFEIRTPGLDSPKPEEKEWVVLVAAYLGNTRLIDNLRVSS
ncbi:MAG: pantoate--beta-alanine ligase [Gammaproteobacteria bacterium]|nr:pantoate--beta-alanine ligase [Gammaproteobacteria bacterium]